MAVCWLGQCPPPPDVDFGLWNRETQPYLRFFSMQTLTALGCNVHYLKKECLEYGSKATTHLFLAKEDFKMA
eukprot:12917901-Prorocentrum_lima.AAC.1